MIIIKKSFCNSKKKHRKIRKSSFLDSIYHFLIYLTPKLIGFLVYSALHPESLSDINFWFSFSHTYCVLISCKYFMRFLWFFYGIISNNQFHFAAAVFLRCCLRICFLLVSKFFASRCNVRNLLWITNMIFSLLPSLTHALLTSHTLCCRWDPFLQNAHTHTHMEYM